jgi:hypothetical protein
MIPYGRYFQKAHTKESAFYKRRSRNRIPAICPGCLAHCAIIGNLRGNLLFQRYCGNRSQAAYKLYWRTHPEEFAAMMESFRKR